MDEHLPDSVSFPSKRDQNDSAPESGSRTDHMSSSFIESNELIKVPHRFNLMLILYSRGPQNFTTLRKILHMTPGNIDHHLKKLLEIKWVQERTVFAFRPIKIFEITEEGRHEFYQYAKQMKSLLDEI